MQAVILAGGLGTRLKPYTDNHPKPMIMIEGIPFLEHLIRQVSDWGIHDVVLLLGYRAEEIVDYFGNGKQFNVNIVSAVTPVDYDTGKRIKEAESLLQNEFLLMYCDNYCPINYAEAYKRFEEGEKDIQLTAYANKDGYTKNNIYEKEGFVLAYDKSRSKENLNVVDIGYAFIKKRSLRYLPGGNSNFESVVYPAVIKNDGMGCYVTEHRYYSIGSWERMKMTESFFEEKKVCFLDRDGTVNERPPKAQYVEKYEDFIWLKGAREAIKLLNENGFKVFMITNQPGIARGNLTLEDLNMIHEKMLHDLAEVGASIDEIFMCPHNWDEGCDCRKPKPGMIFYAQKKYSLNLTKCFLVGDDQRDIDAGIAAGVGHNILLHENYGLIEAVYSILDSLKI